MTQKSAFPGKSIFDGLWGQILAVDGSKRPLDLPALLGPGVGCCGCSCTSWSSVVDARIIRSRPYIMISAHELDSLAWESVAFIVARYAVQ